MAEQQLRRRVRSRKVGATVTAKQTQAQLEGALLNIADITDKMAALQGLLSEAEDVASNHMNSLNLSKFSIGRVSATYDHPAQKTTNTIDAEGLFEDVSPEDFLSSVKVQVTAAKAVIDPKILAKHTTSSKSALKPKTLKVKLTK